MKKIRYIDVEKKKVEGNLNSLIKDYPEVEPYKFEVLNKFLNHLSDLNVEFYVSVFGKNPMLRVYNEGKCVLNVFIVGNIIRIKDKEVDIEDVDTALKIARRHTNEYYVYKLF